MLLVVFEEFEVVCRLFDTLFFSLSLLLGKRSSVEKSGGAAAPLQVPRFPRTWLLTELSQTFACIPHDIFTAKFIAYRLDMKTLFTI